MKLSIRQQQEEAVMRYLHDAKESFIGCQLFIRIDFPEAKIETQLLYQLESVFQSPSRCLIMYWNLPQLRLFLNTKGISNCRWLKLWFCINKSYTNDTGSVLMQWIRTRSSQNERSHLILTSCPRQFIMEIIQGLRNIFQHENQPQSELLITLEESWEDDKVCLSSDPDFSTLNNSTGERLSVFQYKISNYYPNNCVRLWRRPVVNDVLDSTTFSCLECLENAAKLNQFDMEFYSLYYD
ncbi:hypothetical protein DdX_11707 [Ditylenchus destructor]|uniref:Uncharacterized protein n=1 Tax=Ditylenchus destructor TaxID=166010 RepID=A0AAD4N1Z1_9BILA|nr:hypothetical protein DdX_11707 [Ditylenchus destructor]